MITDHLPSLPKFRFTAGNLINDKRSIELGSGTGAVSIAAAALGAKSVVATDLPLLLPLIETNINQNNYSSIITPLELDWQIKGVPDSLQPPFEVVLASDVLYQPDGLNFFVDKLKELCDTNTLVLLSNEHRPALPFPLKLFHDAGFSVKEVAAKDLHPEWQSPDIQVYKLVFEQQQRI